MRFSTTFSTTYFFASILLLIQELKSIFWHLLIVEGDIYRGVISTKRDSRR